MTGSSDYRGEAKVTIRGEEVGKLGRGDHFGEIALIDGGQRLATVTATTDLVSQGLMFWEFRPLVQQNGAIGWKAVGRTTPRSPSRRRRGRPTSRRRR